MSARLHLAHGTDQPLDLSVAPIKGRRRDPGHLQVKTSGEPGLVMDRAVPFLPADHAVRQPFLGLSDRFRMIGSGEVCHQAPDTGEGASSSDEPCLVLLLGKYNGHGTILRHTPTHVLEQFSTKQVPRGAMHRVPTRRLAITVE